MIQWALAAVLIALFLWVALKATRPLARPATPVSSTSPAWTTGATLNNPGAPQEPTGLPVDKLPFGGPPGQSVLTPTLNRGGNAGYTTPVTSGWRGGWLGLNLP